ncbi:MAG: hypothetical protein N2D54_09895 [Chloroflexota bacterium]
MLNSISMRPIRVWKLCLYLIASYLLLGSVHAQGFTQVNIFSPQAGDAIRGVVEITGNAAVDGFSGYEVAFSFQDDATQTWFLISRGDEQIRENTLGEWDTSGMTDGSYALRLMVLRDGDTPIIDIVENLRLRNYTAVETSTPALTTTREAQPQQGTATGEASQRPTPTQLPQNPAILEEEDIVSSARNGVILAVILIIVFGVYTTAKKRAG